jgi:hypothetical protein
VYIVHRPAPEIQTEGVYSYIGGQPMLPFGFEIPKFDLTGTDLTFFFQFSLPEGHVWNGKIISVFCVTDFAREDILLPNLPEPLREAKLTQSFFEGYQTFFRVFIFDKSHLNLATGYKPVIEYHELRVLDLINDGDILFGEVGDRPNWILEDESPSDFEGKASHLHFLFQTKIDYEFAKCADAARQRVIDYGSSTPAHTESYVDTYSLFVANETYFFGIDGDVKDEIYLVPQS